MNFVNFDPSVIYMYIPVIVVRDKVSQPVKQGLLSLVDVFPGEGQSVDGRTLQPRHYCLQTVNVVQVLQFLEKKGRGGVMSAEGTDFGTRNFNR